MNRLTTSLTSSWFPEPVRQVADEGTLAGAAPAEEVAAPPPAVEPAPASSLLGEAEAEAEAPAPLTAESLTVPEGVSPELISGFLEIMNDGELSREALAQKLVDYQVAAQTAGNEAAMAAAQTLWDDTQSQWQAEARGLPELGGEALPATLATIKRGLSAVGADKATFEALDLTGAGNHPAIIKVLHALTKNLSEGGPISGSPPAGKLSQAERMFPGHTD